MDSEEENSIESLKSLIEDQLCLNNLKVADLLIEDLQRNCQSVSNVRYELESMEHELFLLKIVKNAQQETMQNEKLWLDILSQLTGIANSMEQLVVALKNNNNMKREIEA